MSLPVKPGHVRDIFPVAQCKPVVSPVPLSCKLVRLVIDVLVWVLLRVIQQRKHFSVESLLIKSLFLFFLEHNCSTCGIFIQCIYFTIRHTRHSISLVNWSSYLKKKLKKNIASLFLFVVCCCRNSVFYFDKVKSSFIQLNCPCWQVIMYCSRSWLHF